MAMVGSIFDIQRFAVHDGPGIRTTVFFKGCSNRCGWCHNPESLQTMPQLQYFPHRCVGCGACAAVCPQHAHILGETHVLDRLRCVECGACAKVCPAAAIPADDPKKTDHKKCIGCMKCVRTCRQKARAVNSIKLGMLGKKLTKVCSSDKKAEFFF